MEPLVRVKGAGAALFASDMHLDDAHPALVERFLAALDGGMAAAFGTAAGTGERPALFLMGDLFEYWIGDDNVPPAAQALSARLALLAAAGARIHLMHGNRDFLLDVSVPSSPGTPRFSERCGATLLADPTLIEVDGRRIVLSHGDALCVADTRYQQWRALCRSEPWQQDFLARPIAERQAMALSLRRESLQAQTATETLSDVDQEAVDQLLDRFGADLLIHGHTHRPKVHRWREGEDSAWRERWVLSDWATEPARGDLLSTTAIAPAG